MLSLREGRRSGFTLIEILIVVLVIAILSMVALPLFISAVDDSETKTCHANQQSIANAVQAKRVKDKAPDYAAAIAGGVSVLPDLGDIVCPRAGTYSVSMGSSGDTGSFQVDCSVPSHGSFEPGH